MGNNAFWKKFEKSGRIKDYLEYACTVEEPDSPYDACYDEHYDEHYDDCYDEYDDEYDSDYDNGIYIDDYYD